MILGGYFTPAIIRTQEARNKSIWLVLTGWTVQGVSGATFGMTSYLLYHKLPEIGRIGNLMLFIKIICVFTGFISIASYSIWAKNWDEKTKNLIWNFSSILAAIALSAAAFLRWFS